MTDERTPTLSASKTGLAYAVDNSMISPAMADILNSAAFSPDTTPVLAEIESVAGRDEALQVAAELVNYAADHYSHFEVWPFEFVTYGLKGIHNMTLPAQDDLDGEDEVSLSTAEVEAVYRDFVGWDALKKESKWFESRQPAPHANTGFPITQ